MLHAADQAQDGRLARRRELAQLERSAKAQRLLTEEARIKAELAERQRSESEAQLGRTRQAHLQAARRAVDKRIEDERLRHRAQQVAADRTRLQRELAELGHDMDRAGRSVLGEEPLRILADRAAEGERTLETRRSAFARAQDASVRWREATREAERELDAYLADARILRERLDAGTLRCEALGTAVRALERQREDLLALIATIRDESARGELQRAIEARLAAEQRLADRRQQAETLALQCRESDEHRQSVERSLQPMRDAIAAASLEEQAAQLGAEQFDQLLREARQDPAALKSMAESMGLSTQPSGLQAALNQLAEEIAALGPVNLAALEELNAAREREGFVASQSADLREAMRVLEDAIRRIDRETRGLLRETYDQVNLNFGRFFPRLFGGGEARLLLSGEEILDAGVQVIAQPPGKRNSSIHVLSGGEKALTAIALVFAIFQLNPAPFCLLDEVDAPLDDANTERYCDIVRTMSEHTQFLFITHNKVAMELAEQLVGVTMQERGVSRLVAVDLESAASYAEAA